VRAGKGVVVHTRTILACSRMQERVAPAAARTSMRYKILKRIRYSSPSTTSTTLRMSRVAPRQALSRTQAAVP